jgi:hypothetical protein
MKSYKSLLVLLLAAGLCGCNLLGNQQAQQSLPFNGGIKSVSDLQSALTGAYNDLQTLTNGYSFGETFFTQESLTSDGIFVGSFPTFRTIYFRKMAASNGNIEDMWNGPYQDINDANILLQSINKGDIKGLTTAQSNNIKGQALFIRSVQYFYLLKMFALPASAGENNMGVPLQLKAVTSQTDFTKPARSSIKDVYDKIVTDLQTAVGLLPDASGPDSRYRGNKGAAEALLARIALVRGNYQKAAAWSDSVITSGNFELLPDVDTYFTDEGSRESIFEIKNTDQDPTNNAANGSLTSEYNPLGGRGGDIQIGQAFVNALGKELNARQKAAIEAAGATATDTRITELIVKNDGTPVAGLDSVIAGKTYTYKYSEGSQQLSDDVPVLPYPEMILTQAEALARLNGVNQKSIDLLNQIRERAFRVKGGPESLIDYTRADFATKQDLINAILNERFVELAYEGHRKADLQRTKRDVGIGDRALPYNSPKLVFPIPITQIDANKNINQNSGYGS